MIIEPCSCPSTSTASKKYPTNQIPMAMNKPNIKQNGHSNTNENRTDDDYGGGGGNENGNPDISSYVFKFLL